MTRRGKNFDDDEDPSFDDEPWEGDDADDDSDDDTLPCPCCGAAIYDDAVQCPKCGEYLSREERTRPTQPKWVILTALVLLAGLLFAYLR